MKRTTQIFKLQLPPTSPTSTHVWRLFSNGERKVPHLQQTVSEGQINLRKDLIITKKEAPLITSLIWFVQIGICLGGFDPGA